MSAITFKMARVIASMTPEHELIERLERQLEIYKTTLEPDDRPSMHFHSIMLKWNDEGKSLQEIITDEMNEDYEMLEKMRNIKKEF